MQRLLPRRRTPELSYLCAKHGAKEANRCAAQSVKHICGLSTLGHATVRRETIACGEEIEDEQCLAGWLAMTGQSKRTDNPAKHLRVAIDGTVVTSTPNDEFRNFEVIAGRVARDGHPGRRFVCAMQRRSLTRLLVAGALAQSGLTRSTVVDVVNDGARGMRKLVEDVTPMLAPRMIDWFHIAMKLHALRTPIEARTCY